MNATSRVRLAVPDAMAKAPAIPASRMPIFQVSTKSRIAPLHGGMAIAKMTDASSRALDAAAITCGEGA